MLHHAYIVQNAEWERIPGIAYSFWYPVSDVVRNKLRVTDLRLPVKLSPIGFQHLVVSLSAGKDKNLVSLDELVLAITLEKRECCDISFAAKIFAVILHRVSDRSIFKARCWEDASLAVAKTLLLGPCNTTIGDAVLSCSTEFMYNDPVAILINLLSLSHLVRAHLQEPQFRFILTQYLRSFSSLSDSLFWVLTHLDFACAQYEESLSVVPMRWLTDLYVEMLGPDGKLRHTLEVSSETVQRMSFYHVLLSTLQVVTFRFKHDPSTVSLPAAVLAAEFLFALKSAPQSDDRNACHAHVVMTVLGTDLTKHDQLLASRGQIPSEKHSVAKIMRRCKSAVKYRQMQCQVMCACCGKMGSGASCFKKCSQCGFVRYCCSQCQEIHWTIHKKFCKELACRNV